MTTNCYPKSSFLKDETVYVGCFKSELEDDFYFYNSYDNKIYKLNKIPDLSILKKDTFNGKTKYLVELSKTSMVWEDIPFEELPDLAYNKMTLRHHACIELGVANSGLAWLDEIIKSRRRD